MMAKPWNEFREVITRLYLHDGRKLEDVRAIMKQEYGFEASIRSYRQHFDQWNVGKYNCKKRISRHQAKRALLPSPPQTPVFGTVSSAMILRQDGILVGPITPPSPGSVSTRSSISNSRHSPGCVSVRTSISHHSPEQRPLPDPMSTVSQHRIVNVPSRYPPCYEVPISNDLVIRDKNPMRQRALSTTMGPPSHIYGADDLQDALRGPHMGDGTLPFVKAPTSPILAERDRTVDHSTVALSNISCEPSRHSVKYLHPSNYQDTQNWSMSRSTPPVPFQLGCGSENSYYRLYTPTSRMTEPFSVASTPRSLQHNELKLSPRVKEERIVSPSGMNKNVPEHLTSTHMSFEIVSG